jgi:replicative DNA helicase
LAGPAYLSDLIAHVPTTANVEHYIDIVWEKIQLRQLIGAAHEVISQAFEQQDDVKAWIDEAEQRIFNITAEKTGDVIKPAKPLVMDAMSSIERMYEKRGEVMGLATGLRDLDKLTSGLHDGNLIHHCRSTLDGQDRAGDEHRREGGGRPQYSLSAYSAWKCRGRN